MTDVKLFIGAPSEDEGLSAALQGALDRDASVRIWHQGTFEANYGTLESLLAAIEEYDFACFLAPPVDKVESRGTVHDATRDNIIFEYGLFLGRLGRDRVFLIHPRDTPLELPSDLKGVNPLTYKPIDDDNLAAAVLEPPAQKVREHIKRLGHRQQKPQRRHSPVLESRTIDRVANVCDSAIYYARRRYGYKDDIRQLVLAGKVIPSLYYYATEEGAEFWLKMSSNPQYRFKSNSMRLIREVAKGVAEAVRDSVNGDGSVDLVSLGSGDGQKDRLLLTALGEKVPSLTYYPLDISDALIADCIKNIPSSYAGIKTKAIIGDFIDLEVLRSVYEDRPSPNIFSVLGNTFGNTDEAQIIEALQKSMFPGDFLLIEINCDIKEVGSTNSFLENEDTLRYACIPLEMIDQKIDLTKVIVREEERSVFSCAKSSATLYGEIALDGKEITEVPLAFDHRYPLDGFERELADNLDVEIMLTKQYGNAAVVLAKKT
jgi:Histidine-specific methyltransferase, SAM-dependent/Predicted nucleotide-binding protein containing TIR-like domain